MCNDVCIARSQGDLLKIIPRPGIHPYYKQPLIHVIGAGSGS